MPDEFLIRLGMYVGGGQHADELVLQRVEVERPIRIVALGNAGRLKIVPHYFSPVPIDCPSSGPQRAVCCA